MKDRIKMIMESRHMTQQTFAQFIQMSPASLSSIFNGRTRPTINIVEAIKNKIPNISTDWLMFGIGDMYLSGQSAKTAPSTPVSDTSESPMLDFEGDSTTPSGSSETVFSHGVPSTPLKKVETVVKYVDKPQRKVTEIRIFYDDQTWETFVPKQ